MKIGDDIYLKEKNGIRSCVINPDSLTGIAGNSVVISVICIYFFSIYFIFLVGYHYKKEKRESKRKNKKGKVKRGN